ncbi:MAG: hypothetical protein ABIQ12_07610 [Opitutaceae bacterium]
MKVAHSHLLLRRFTLIAALVGAAGSLVFMFRVGKRNPSAVLIILFTVWVLMPFAAMVWASRCSKVWTDTARTFLHVLILILTLGSLLIYGDVAFGAPRQQPAFMFLVVPFVSLLVLGVMTFASRVLQKKA